MKKNKILIIILIFLIIISFKIKAANQQEELKIKVKQRVFNLNPIYAANETELMITKQIFDTLLVYDQKGEITSNLAETWVLDDSATTFKFDLKKDVYFQPYKVDGQLIDKEQRKVTAADWKWSLEYLAAPQNKSPYANLLKKIKGFSSYRQGKEAEISGIKVLDTYNLEIELKEPYAPFIYNLLEEAVVVLPKKAILNRDEKFSLSPIGTGAFREKEFAENKIILEKYSDYWKNNYQNKKIPYFNQISFNFANYKDFEKYYNDFDIYQLNSAEYNNYQQEKENYSSYKLQKVFNDTYYYIALNLQKDLAKNIKINDLKSKLNTELTGDFFIDNSKINNLISLSEDNIQTFLDKIYFKNNDNYSMKNQGFSLDIAINNKEQSEKIAQLIKNKLASNNINLRINKYSWTHFLEKVKNNKLEEKLFIMTYEYKNKFDFISDNFYSKSNKNYFNYKNSRIDNMIDYLKVENNKKSQTRSYQIIKNILRENNSYLILLKGVNNYLVTEKLKNQKLLTNNYLKYNLELLEFK